LLEDTGNIGGDAGSHQDVIDPGENRAAEGRGSRELDLGEEIDADLAAMTHLGEFHFDE
jgi:hypothetical protein